MLVRTRCSLSEAPLDREVQGELNFHNEGGKLAVQFTRFRSQSSLHPDDSDVGSFGESIKRLKAREKTTSLSSSRSHAGWSQSQMQSIGYAMAPTGLQLNTVANSFCGSTIKGDRAQSSVSPVHAAHSGNR